VFIDDAKYKGKNRPRQYQLKKRQEACIRMIVFSLINVSGPEEGDENKCEYRDGETSRKMGKELFF